jgi:hypothetical protein
VSVTTTGETVQATAAAAGQESAATTGTTASAATGTEAAKTYDETYVKKLRDEAAAHRTKLKAFEDAEQARKDAELTATQLAEKKAADAEAKVAAAETRVRTALATAVLTTEASAAGMKPSAVARVVRLAGGDVAFDDEGQPTNAKALIAALAKEFPEFLTGSEGTTSPANPGRGSGPTITDPKLIPRLGAPGLFKTPAG